VTIVQLAASPFVGGPERQMLGLAANLPTDYRTVFLSFAEGGRCRAILDAARAQGHEAHALRANAPHHWRAATEIAEHLGRVRADVLCCNGYKPDIIGRLAARRSGVPVISISHGWTGATWKVRLNEALDRFLLNRMDAVVCVSEAQAARVRQCGVSPEKIAVIRNAVDRRLFADPDPRRRDELEGRFARRPKWIVGAAGRLSKEKGFLHFVEAAAQVHRALPDAAFVLFGDGPEHESLQCAVAQHGLQDCFVLPGFRTDVAAFLPWFDVFALSSFTEGLPVVVLEAMAAGVPVVATAAGGTPEAVVEGVTGHLVAPSNPSALSRRLIELLRDESRRRQMGLEAKRRIEELFTFEAQCESYLRLFERLVGTQPVPDRSPVLLSGLK
jgi:glycosyltransferase involved in cell wall biosynthesis